MLRCGPPDPRHYENRKEATRSFAKIDPGAGLSRLQDEEE
jgi:hypothetical protein